MGKKSLKFEVQGSAAEPYEVEFIFNDGELRAWCSCPAGSHGQMCKHRISLMCGDSKNIVGGDISNIDELQRWAEECGILDLISELNVKKESVEAAKKDVKEARQKLINRLRAS